MNKKVKIYFAAMTAAAIVTAALIVSLFGSDQQIPPADSPAAVTKENEPIEAVVKTDPEPEPVMAIPATPNGVLERKAPVQAEVPASKLESNTPAKSDAPEWRGPTLEDLEKLRSENALLEAQLKNAELKSKIASQGGGISPGAVNDVAHNATAQGPRVVMIAGGENNFRANVVMPSGAAISAGVGTTIPGVGVVSAITSNEVIVGRGSAKRALPLFNRTADGY